MTVTRELLLALSDDELLGQCEVDRYRASGPGGQKRNKTASAVRLRHQPTGLIALSTDSRSQHQNRARALRRLRERIAFDLRQPAEVEEYAPPPPLAELVAAGIHRRGPRQRHSLAYLTAVGFLLDLFVACECSVSKAAKCLELSTGALSRLLLGDERIARKVNELRQARGMRPLR